MKCRLHFFPFIIHTSLWLFSHFLVPVKANPMHQWLSLCSFRLWNMIFPLTPNCLFHTFFSTAHLFSTQQKFNSLHLSRSVKAISYLNVTVIICIDMHPYSCTIYATLRFMFSLFLFMFRCPFRFSFMSRYIFSHLITKCTFWLYDVQVHSHPASTTFIISMWVCILSHWNFDIDSRDFQSTPYDDECIRYIASFIHHKI